MALRRLSALGFLAVVSGACTRGAPALDPLEVYAASSLTEAFRALEEEFEVRHPGVDVVSTFAGSQVHRLQIEQGARADLFASANPRHVEALTAAGLAEPPRIFARNRLVVIVPASNPAGLESFDDLPRAERLVLGAPEVPVGRYAREVIRRAGARRGEAFEDALMTSIASSESNVRLVRAKVELGEADAAFVYRTDAIGLDGVRVLSVPDDLNVVAEYPMAVIREAASPELARAWMAFVLSDDGQAILARHGFDPPRGAER